MLFSPTLNTVKIEMVYSIGTGIAENVYHVNTGEAITPTHLETIVNVFAEWQTQHARALQAAEVKMFKIKATDISQQNGYYLEWAPTSLIYDGSRVSPILPMNVTAAIKCNSGHAGRSYRGRVFWIGLTEDAVVGDGIASTVVDGLILCLGQLKSRVEALGYSLGVVSYFQDHQQRPLGLFTPFTFFTMDAVVDSQRRRLSGRGS